MARVTVEDCIDKVENRFELVMVSAQRARKIGAGAALTVERDNDKNPVIALREIAAETVVVEDLKDEIIKSHQRMVAYEEEEDIDLMDGEEEWGSMASGTSQEPSIYGGEEIVEDEKREPSLQDLAGNPPVEDA